MKLYHGSGHNHKVLKPGFMRTGQEMNWDETESNHFLYASTVREHAIDQGFASMLDQLFFIDGYHNKGTSVVVDLNSAHPVNLAVLSKIIVYCYRIRFDEKDGWVKNNNAHNGLKTEWKTPKVIKDNIERTISIPVGQLMSDLLVSHDEKHLVFDKVNFNSMGIEAIDFPGWSGW